MKSRHKDTGILPQLKKIALTSLELGREMARERVQVLLNDLSQRGAGRWVDRAREWLGLEAPKVAAPARSSRRKA